MQKIPASFKAHRIWNLFSERILNAEQKEEKEWRKENHIQKKKKLHNLCIIA